MLNINKRKYVENQDSQKYIKTNSFNVLYCQSCVWNEYTINVLNVANHHKHYVA